MTGAADLTPDNPEIAALIRELQGIGKSLAVIERALVGAGDVGDAGEMLRIVRQAQRDAGEALIHLLDRAALPGEPLAQKEPEQ